MKQFGIALALFAVMSCAAPQSTPSRPPNIVIVFIDDMGYADIGPFGAKAYATPNLDRLAREGRVFTDFYVSQAVCSASRASLMTGCYNVRVGITGALGPKSKIGISDGEVTLAQICKQKGYATACYGKWHLGDAKQFLPMRHGFDDYFGLPYSNDMWPLHPTAGKNFPDLPLIEKNKDRPFFLYVPHTMVHVPLHVSDRFRGKSGAGLFGDAVMEVDWSVGEIVESIRKNGLEKDTILLFTSD